MPKPFLVSQSGPLLEQMFSAWPEEKKKQIRTWLKFQSVAVNGRPVSQFNHPLSVGDTVSIRSDRFAAPKTSLPSGIQIFFEDAHLLVISKPENLLSIASEAEPEKTAYFQLTEYVRQAHPRSKQRVWIVHRLDRETSGLMVFAKTPETKESLQRTWDQFEKKYEAVIEGHLPQDLHTIESDLDESNPFKVFIRPASALTRHAITHVRTLKKNRHRSLVELTLETGRRHQLRVQLSSLGYPIVGDEKYGAKSDPAKRLGLHACFLRLIHPVTQQELRFTCPLPKSLARLVSDS
ncbi:MAG: RluA family pseudouridine synthase [Verrucomicrobia bacterium]|nr:RluA family pseudouridine synthase [Verrucomicrobiota bacterium]